MLQNTVLFFKNLSKSRMLFSRMLRIRFYLIVYRLVQKKDKNLTDQEMQKRISDSIREKTGCRVAILMPGNGIGDTIVISGLIYILKQHACEISIVCYDRLLSVLPEIMPFVDSFIRVDKHDFFGKYLKNRKKADVVLDFANPNVNFDHHKLKSLLTLDCQNVIGFNQDLEHSGVPIPDNPPRNFFSMIKEIYARSYTAIESRPFLSRSVTLLRDYFGIAISETDYRYHLEVPAATENRVTAWLGEIRNRKNEKLPNGFPPRKVLINATASTPERSLSAELINKACDYLLHCSEKYVIVLLNLGSGDLKLTSSRIVFSPFKTFAEAAMLIKHSDFVLSPDTSFVHVASAFGKHGIFAYIKTKSELGYENNVAWKPVHENCLQICHEPEPGAENDLRDLKFEILKEALISKGIV